MGTENFTDSFITGRGHGELKALLEYLIVTMMAKVGNSSIPMSNDTSGDIIMAGCIINFRTAACIRYCIVMGNRLKIIIDYRLESVCVSDAILSIIIGL